MLNIKKRPYQLLLFTAIALLFALVFSPVAQIDLRDKTMFSVPLATMVWIIPLFLISSWLLYILTNRYLYSVTVTRTHVLTTVLTTILLVVILYIGIDPSYPVDGRQELIGNAMQILSVIFVCAQLIYLANVLLGIFTKNKITGINKPYEI